MKMNFITPAKILGLHTGDDTNFSIEHRLFNLVCFFAGLIGIATVIINIIIGAPLDLTIVSASVGIVCWLVFYFSRFRNGFRAGRWILTIFMFLLFAYIFFINNGSQGPLLHLYMAFFLLLLFVWNGFERLLIIFFFILNITAFFLIELNYPDLIKPYDLEKTRIMDIYLSYYLYIILVGVILMFAKNSYIKEKKKAEQSDHLKSAFLANMSHEIRTPMNAILGFTQLLYRDLPKKKREEYLKVIHDNSHSLLRLIEDIIDISKIEAGELSFKNEDCDLNAIVSEISLAYRQMLKDFPDKEIMLIEKLPQKALIIKGDGTRLKQILSNLVSNSFKYTEKGNITISYDQYGKWIRFTVRDTGLGIKEEYLNEIFDRFRKIETEESYKIQPGTGIGLSISKNLVKLMGGEIGVESTYGEGSEFHFTIPFVPSEKNSIKKDIEVKILSADDISFNGKLILIAEDEKTNFEFLKKVLDRTGAKVLHASDGEEAVRIFSENEIDLVLMDIMMPVMNGYEASKEIKKLNPNVPIIAQTALAMEGDAEKVLGSGCDEYISKPIRINELLRKMLKQFD